MLGVSKLKNPIRAYPWGSHTDIPELLGEESPSPEPVAELWIGAYELDSSEVCANSHGGLLAEVIRRDPAGILGRHQLEDHGSALPFLLKVLAVERPLSLQVHPDLHQAADGYAREDRLGIEPAGRERCYRDRNHKPEILYALKPFVMLRGFREIPEMVGLIDRLELADVLPPMDRLRQTGDAEGLAEFFSAYLSLEGEAAQRLVERGVEAAARHVGESPAFAWIPELASFHPGDVGVLAPLFLHLLELQPGQAVYTPPGVLHAYLRGVGIELMASSDNVVRAALTSKHRDIPELLHITRFESSLPIRVEPLRQSLTEQLFETPAEEFVLARIQVREGVEHREGEGRGVEIFLCLEGAGTFREDGTGRSLDFKRGESILVPASVEGYSLEGQATLFRAGVAHP